MIYIHPGKAMTVLDGAVMADTSDLVIFIGYVPRS